MANEQGATQPNPSLCLTQAALIYATPPLYVLFDVPVVYLLISILVLTERLVLPLHW